MPNAATKVKGNYRLKRGQFTNTKTLCVTYRRLLMSGYRVNFKAQVPDLNKLYRERYVEIAFLSILKL